MGETISYCLPKGIPEEVLVKMDEAAKADRVVVLHKGKVAADGTPREVFSKVELLHNINLNSAELGVHS